MKCEQSNCVFDARLVVWADDTLFLLCGQHENELARMEGDDFLEEFNIEDPNLLPKLIKFINENFQKESTRYSKLLKTYSDLKNSSAASTETS